MEDEDEEDERVEEGEEMEVSFEGRMSDTETVRKGTNNHMYSLQYTYLTIVSACYVPIYRCASNTRLINIWGKWTTPICNRHDKDYFTVKLQHLKLLLTNVTHLTIHSLA